MTVLLKQIFITSTGTVPLLFCDEVFSVLICNWHVEKEISIKEVRQKERPIWRLRHKLEIDIKMYAKGIGCDSINEINMAQKRHTWDVW